MLFCEWACFIRKMSALDKWSRILFGLYIWLFFHKTSSPFQCAPDANRWKIPVKVLLILETVNSNSSELMQINWQKQTEQQKPFEFSFHVRFISAFSLSTRDFNLISRLFLLPAVYYFLTTKPLFFCITLSILSDQDFINTHQLINALGWTNDLQSAQSIIMR